jgi:hypothetical protein
MIPTFISTRPSWIGLGIANFALSTYRANPISSNLQENRTYMVKIRRVDRDLMDAPKRRSARSELTPLQRERQRQQNQFARLIRDLSGPDDVFEVSLGPNDKPLTVRQRLLRVAEQEGRQIAVRKHDNGFLVGLLTPERQTRRGRRPAGASA